MAIDLIALKRAADGNPEQQIAVKRKLLQDAYNALTSNLAQKPEKSKKSLEFKED